jgi:flagellar hook assembly protein FlgD
VKLQIYDVLGGRIKTLLDRRLEAGEHLIQWDGTDDRGEPVATGVYFCRLAAPSFVETRKVTLLR